MLCSEVERFEITRMLDAEKKGENNEKTFLVVL